MLNRPLLRFIYFLCPALLLCAVAGASEITGYGAIFAPYAENGTIKIAIRRFERGGKTEYLNVDALTFETSISAAVPTMKKVVRVPVENTPFVRALKRYTSPPVKLQNHGITRSENDTAGVFVTADMCPSKRRFEREMFTATVDAAVAPPAPIALAVSGAWITGHSGEFEWILKEIRERRLDVTWINHGYHHPYKGGKPLEEDFLLAAGVDFEKEVLDNERLMISSGITPSPFFRFPGLVADEELIKKLKTLSLIPVGSDAWLAKDEMPSGGSIILVHGNGNEPEGIERLIGYYKDARAKGGLKILPLKDAFSVKTPAQ